MFAHLERYGQSNSVQYHEQRRKAEGTEEKRKEQRERKKADAEEKMKKVDTIVKKNKKMEVEMEVLSTSSNDALKKHPTFLFSFVFSLSLDRIGEDEKK